MTLKRGSKDDTRKTVALSRGWAKQRKRQGCARGRQAALVTSGVMSTLQKALPSMASSLILSFLLWEAPNAEKQHQNLWARELLKQVCQCSFGLDQGLMNSKWTIKKSFKST